MSESDAHPVKPITAIFAALTVTLTLTLLLTLAAKAASARQQEAQSANPQAAAAPDAPPPADAPGGEPQPPGAQTQPAPETQPAETQPDASSSSSPDAPYLQPVLAEHLAELAQARLREANVTEPMWRQAAALLQAASRLSPRDPRFPRMLIEARLKVGDRPGAIAAINAYRKLDPADRVAQIQLIDLYAEQMQTADARLDYLRDVLKRETIPEEVRSHVAAACVPLLLERSQDEAASMVEEALRLFPLNPTALRLKYRLLPADAAPAARAEVLLAMLRSNPAQPDVVNELAGLLAGVGMGKDALEWYWVALRLYPRAGLPFPQGFVADAGAQLLMSNQAQSLDTMLSAYLQARPDDADAWFLRLAKEKAGAEKAGTAKIDRKSIDDAWKALATNLAEVCQAIAGGEAKPATAPALGTGPNVGGGAAPQRPAPSSGGPAGAAAAPAPGSSAAGAGGAPAPAAPTIKPATAADAMQAAKRVKAGEAPELRAALTATLSDLAWLELYFGEDADAAGNWIAALRDVLAPDSVTLVRLEGWLDLVAGRTEQAKAKLAPIAERDGLAALGMVRLAAKDAGGQAEADETAAKLLSTYRSGLVGAIVWSSLHDRGAKPTDDPAAADIRAKLEQFPRDWMQILEKPDAYYDLAPEVVKTAHRYREPMFSRVTIRNKTDFDLTVGPDGVIRPDLWFDAKMTGLVSQNFPGVAYDRIARFIVLPAHQQIVQFVRVDQGLLAETLDQNPSASAQINGSVVINPAPLSGGIGPGPAGQRKSLAKAFVRSGFALAQPVARRRLTTAIESGSTDDRIRGLDLLSGYLRMLARQKNLDAGTRSLAAEFLATLSTSRSDSIRPVAIWATYLTARFNGDERAAAMNALLADEGWPARLLAVLAAADLGAEKQSQVATQLAAEDPEPTVKEFAAATIDDLRSMPATQPATADADAAPAQAREAPAPASPGASVPTEPPPNGSRR